jgi:hypothetical protein
MRWIPGWFAVALVLILLVSGRPAWSQATSPTVEQLETILDGIAGKVAAERYDEVTDELTRLIGDPSQTDKLRKAFQAFAPLGKPVYSDKIVDRAYGSSGRDVIHKIAYEQGMLFLRFIVHRRANGWGIINFSFQTENEAPLPRAWQHINP